MANGHALEKGHSLFNPAVRVPIWVESSEFGDGVFGAGTAPTGKVGINPKGKF